MKLSTTTRVGDKVLFTIPNYNTGEQIDIVGIVAAYKADFSSYFVEFDYSIQYNGWYTREELANI